VKQEEQGLNFIRSAEIKGLFDSSVALEPLMDELPIGMVIIDKERRVMFLNKAFQTLTGFSLEDVWGVPCRHVMRNSLCHQKCPVVHDSDSSHAVRFECDIINKERKKISVRISANEIRDHNNDLVGFIETVEDISDQSEDTFKFQQGQGFGQLLGHSPKMEDLFRIIPVIAQTDSSVLITGETGTGKDILAEVVHEASSRSKEAFIKINCGALPETLLESELFGHQKGAFTGATTDKPGRIRLAHEGSLYLTEIGDLSLKLQVKLLTFLDDKVVYPLGGTKGFQADVRILAATHRNLEKMVKEGTFREDLLYRLNVIRMHMPPLKERGEDIGLLSDHFINLFATRFGKKIKGMSGETRSIIERYSFPGNVRELRNILEYATNLCQEDYLLPEHLPVYIFSPDPAAVEEKYDDQDAFDIYEPKTVNDTGKTNWVDIERQMIIGALVKSKGKRSKAAESLGWCRSTLWRKMKNHQIEA